MQAVLLVAGKSSRLYPYTHGMHKSMISILGKPLLEHTILGLKKAGITKIVLVIDVNSIIPPHFSDGKKLGVAITYVVQQEQHGMGNALLSAEDVLEDEFLLLHGYHIDVAAFVKKLIAKKKKGVDGVLLAEKRSDTWKYGVLKINGDKVITIKEKPKIGKESSKLCVVGIYLLSKTFLDTLHNTQKEKYQFETALSLFAKDNQLVYETAKETTVVLKYPWDILSMKNYLLAKGKRNIAKSAKVAKTAEIQGDVVIERDVVIMEGARIKGPCFIGKGVFVGTNAIIRNNSSIEAGCTVGAGIEIKNTLMMDGTTTHSGFIGDSVIGKNCKIAALFCTANVRLDRKQVQVFVHDEKIDTNVKSLGIFMGHNTKVGIRVSTMPGVVIGNNANIGPSTTIMKNIPSNVSYYTTFKEIVEVTEERVPSSGRKIILFDIDYTLFDTDAFKASNLTKFVLYEEVLDVLTQLKNTADLGIFSEGNLDFQKTKLLKTEIKEHFIEKHVHIVDKKEETIEAILGKYKKLSIVLVDDKLPVLAQAKKILPSLFTVWVKRGMYALVQQPIEGFAPDAIISDLYELTAIVGSIQ